MERINQFALYELGQALGALRNLKGDVPPATAFSEVVNANSAMTKLLAGDPVPLGVAETRASELAKQISGIWDTYFTKDDGNGGRQFSYPDPNSAAIPSWWWGFVTSALDKFETVFAEEMRENAAYYVPRRGIFYTKALVDAADQAFMKNLLPHIPQKTREDWNAAGRCLAFNLLSASGFHVARAVEGTLETYYQIFCGKPSGSTLRSWNDYIVALEVVRKSGASILPTEKTLAELRQMKDDYRNPIAHPRIVLSEADAKILFNNGESLIIGMAQELCEAQKKAEPSLSLLPAIKEAS